MNKITADHIAITLERLARKLSCTVVVDDQGNARIEAHDRHVGPDPLFVIYEAGKTRL